ETANSITSDRNGNLYITGYTQSTNNISTSNAFQAKLSTSNGNGFIASFPPCFYENKIHSNNSRPICINSFKSFFNSSINKSKYKWKIAKDGNIISGQNTDSINVKWTKAGKDTITLLMEDSTGCKSLSDTIITIHGCPAQSF